MRLTTRTNLAMRTLMYCAVHSDRIVRKSEIACQCNASENHLGLVIHKLSQSGFLTTLRGRNGGMKLSRPAAEISVGGVCREFEACVPFAECFSETENECPLASSCRLQGHLKRALEAFYAELDKISVADLTRDNDGLAELLSWEVA